MADSDKDILITPQVGASNDPSIVFGSGATPADDITLFVTDNGTIATLSFEASAGQLFSISNDLTGIIFSVNDISGVPSLEVNADGTVSIAEFDGEVGIGTSAPTEMLTIQGRDVVSSNAGIRVNARGDAYVKLLADTVSDTELENAYIYMSQDADAVVSVIGTIGAVNVDSQNNTFTGSGNNSLGIHHKFATGEINLGVNGQVGLTIDDSNNVTVENGGSFTGDGSGLTTLTAANISAGNLVTGINVFFNTSSASSAHKVPFLSTTGTSAINSAMLHDTEATFTYNPNTNTLVVGTFSGALSGNATTATAWATGRTITLSGDVSGTSPAWTGSGNLAFTGTVVANDSHTHAFNNLTSKTSGTGNYTTTGDFTADNFEATGLGPNSTPGTDDAYFGGYGVLGSRTGNVYLSNVAGPVALNHTGVHNANTKLVTTSTGVAVTGKVDATGNLETDGNLLVQSGGDYISISHDGTKSTINNLGSSVMEFELTSVVEAQVQDSNVAGNTAGLQVKDHSQTLRDAGFNDLKIVNDNPASVAIVEENMGGVIYADDNTGFTVTLPSSTSSFPVGGVITIVNANTTGNILINDQPNQTCFYLDPGTGRADIAGAANVLPGGVATIWRANTGGTSTERTYIIWGSGITP